MSTYREELEADVDVEEFYDALFGRGPFRDPEDYYAEPRYAPLRSPFRASEVSDPSPEDAA